MLVLVEADVVAVDADTLGIRIDGMVAPLDWVRRGSVVRSVRRAVGIW